MEWKQVKGRIQKGKKFTRFHLEARMTNGLLIEQNVSVSNNELEHLGINFYRYVLDQMVIAMDKQYR